VTRLRASAAFALGVWFCAVEFHESPVMGNSPGPLHRPLRWRESVMFFCPASELDGGMGRAHPDGGVAIDDATFGLDPARAGR